MCVCVCVCVCYRPPVRGVCPNYEVIEFQPRTVTPLEPRLFHLFLRIILVPPRPPFPSSGVLPGGGSPLPPRHPLHRRTKNLLKCKCEKNPTPVLYTTEGKPKESLSPAMMQDIQNIDLLYVWILSRQRKYCVPGSVLYITASTCEKLPGTLSLAGLSLTQKSVFTGIFGDFLVFSLQNRRKHEWTKC